MSGRTGRVTRFVGGRIEELRYLAAAPLHHLPLPTTGSDYVRFLIVAPPRTGSTMLVERCNSHPSVVCVSELLARRSIVWYPELGPRRGVMVRFRDRSALAFLEFCLWHRYPRHVRAVGFKMLDDQFLNDWPSAREHLMSMPDLRVLLLRRENYLERYVSGRIAERTRVFRVLPGTPRREVPPLELSPDECARAFRELASREQAIADSFRRHATLRLTYEALVASPEEQNRRICSFLGVEPLPLAERSLKMERLSMRQRVANFAELRRHFAGTEWAPFFREEAEPPAA